MHREDALHRVRDTSLMFALTPDEWTAVLLSLRIAVVATVVALPFGIAIAWVLARKDFWARRCSTASCICRWCCRRS